MKSETQSVANESVDSIFSNLAVQWCNDLSTLFAELYRVLVPGGTVALTTLGPKTLAELKTAWARVDNCVHVNHFYDATHWAQAIRNSGFTVKLQQQQQYVLYYHKVQELTKELKLLGAHNVNDGQRTSLTGRQHLQQLVTAYEAFRIDDKLPASYEVYYYVLQKL